jgi:hypothetical protein
MDLVKVIFIFLLSGVAVSGFSQSVDKNSVADSDKQSVEIVINGEKTAMPVTSLNTTVNVFSIIGSKVRSIEIKSGSPESPVTLPKGYYILKVDNITRKIAIK